MQIRIAEEADLPTFVGLYNTIWPNHCLGVAGLQRELKLMPEKQRMTIWLAEIGGEAVGFARVYRLIGSFDPFRWYSEIGVLEQHRTKGFGTLIYNSVEGFLGTESAISVTGRVSDQDSPSARFFSKRGFIETKRDFEATLDLQSIDPAVFDHGRDTALELRTVHEADSPEVRRKWHSLFEATRKDIPRDDAPTPFSYDEFHEIFVTDPEFLWNVSSFAFDDERLVALTYLYKSEREGVIFQALTAVDREYRGSGIAKALKTFAARRALDAGFTTILTDNDSRNLAMISINDWMGFTRLPGMISLRKDFVGKT